MKKTKVTEEGSLDKVYQAIEDAHMLDEKEKMEKKTVDKKVTLTLEGMDGNAFFLMSAFQRQAKREGWSKDEIKTVLNDCTSGDYNHLLYVLIEHCNEESED